MRRVDTVPTLVGLFLHFQEPDRSRYSEHLQLEDTTDLTTCVYTSVAVQYKGRSIGEA